MLYQTLLSEISKSFIGNEDVVKKIWMAILAKGHVLLEDIPGVGKTTLTKAFASALDLKVNRMQFSFDVLASDVVGYKYIDRYDGKEKMYYGAIFCNMFLADELNRTSSKTQAALLEAMEEGTVSMEGTTLPLDDIFFVMATQNPYGSAGTQMLPDSQRDRFMIGVSLGYPSKENEVKMLQQKYHHVQNKVNKVIDKETLLKMQEEVKKVFIHPDIMNYIVSIIQEMRSYPAMVLKPSPRASVALCSMAQASAYLEQRDFVVVRDVLNVLESVLNHRIILQNTTPQSYQDMYKHVLAQVPQPELGDIQC